MSRITIALTLALATTALQACAPEGDGNANDNINATGDGLSYSTDRAALARGVKAPLEASQLPPGSKVIEGTPPGALLAEIPLSATCPAGAACLFQDINGGGSGIAISLAPGVGLNLPFIACPGCTNGIHGNDGSWNDQMSSWENASAVQYCWNVDVNGGGVRHPMAPGAPLQNVAPADNDIASSIDRLGC